MDEISETEMWIGGIVLLVAIALAVFFNPFFKAGMLDDLKVFQEALKNENNPGLFDYEVKTNVGNILAYGKAESIEPVGIPELVEKYSIVEREIERYTRHTRQVCASRNKKGDCTAYRTEVYYTWDSAGSNRVTCNSFKFLEKEFTSIQIAFPIPENVQLSKDTVTPEYQDRIHSGYIYEKNKFFASVGDIRWHYKYLPKEFNTSILFRFSDNKITNPLNKRDVVEAFYNLKPAEVIQMKKNNMVIFDWVYYIAWAFLSEGIWFGLAYKAIEL
jgi:hypothetical protein